MSVYNNYGYGNYPYGYGVPYNPYGINGNANNSYQQNNYAQPQPMQQPAQQPQTSYLPLTFTSGLVGAKAFIVAPNQTVFLKDSEEGSDLLFEKSADSYGKYTLKAYKLAEVKIDDIGKNINENSKVETITKKDLQEFATKGDLDSLKSIFENKMNDLSTLIQKGSKTAKIKESDKNE